MKHLLSPDRSRPLRHSRTLIAGALLAALSGCGDDDGKTIDCDWFAGDNCWKETMSAALTCRSTETSGTFNAGRTQCTFTDGTTVDFADPVPQSIFDAVWDFEISNSSGSCMSLREGRDSLAVTTSAGTFKQETVGGEMVITCMDGKKYNIGGFAALGCDLSTLPGYASSDGGGSVTFSLIGDPAATDTKLFTCE